MPKPMLPSMIPSMVRFFSVTVTCGVAVNVTGAVPKLRSLEPVKVKSPPSWMIPCPEKAPLRSKVLADPLVLSMVPPLIVNVPLLPPKATNALAPAAEAKFSVPAVRV